MSAEGRELGSITNWWPCIRPQTSSFPLAVVAAEWWAASVMVEIVSPLSASAGTRAGANITALIGAGTISDACCPKAIQAPGPDIFPVLLNGRGMVYAAADDSALFVQTEGSWEKGIVTLALENAMAELILLARRIPR